jgi:hypothetical protein
MSPSHWSWFYRNIQPFQYWHATSFYWQFIPGISTEPEPSLPTLTELPTKNHQVPIDDDGDDEDEDELDAEIDVNVDDILDELDELPISTELQDAAGDNWIEHED